MKKAPTYEELLVENTILRDQNKRKDERIAYLERMLYGNHPKQADFYMMFLLVNFAVKKRHV